MYNFLENNSSKLCRREESEEEKITQRKTKKNVEFYIFSLAYKKKVIDLFFDFLKTYRSLNAEVLQKIEEEIYIFSLYFGYAWRERELSD